ncbi:MAG: Crp/Fnr family transcriptional regulator [Bacteroidales bacterium]|nr:Crp/Fnr family transcriptional regulator [Bacteroidales bacterium]
MISQQKDKYCINCSCQNHIFHVLSDSELEKVNAHRTEIKFKRGDTIFKQGGPAMQVLLFTDGMAKINIEANGKNLIIGIITQGSLVAGPGMHTDNRHYYSVVALKDCSVCAVDQSVFQALLLNNAAFLNTYLKYINEIYIETLGRLTNQAYKQVKGKVADAIIYLSEHIYKAYNFELILSTREIANLSGVSKESTARTLKELSDENIIRLNRQEINVLNPERLHQLSKMG